MLPRAFLLASGEIGDRTRFNIGTGIKTTDRELHTLVAREAGAADNPTYAPARLGDLRDSAIDSARAADRLGWRPRVNLPDGISATVDYFRGRRG